MKKVFMSLMPRMDKPNEEGGEQPWEKVLEAINNLATKLGTTEENQPPNQEQAPASGTVVQVPIPQSPAELEEELEEEEPEEELPPQPTKTLGRKILDWLG